MDMPGVGVEMILLNSENQVLLLLRNSDKNKADSDMRLEGLYTLPSGKVRYSEKLKDAVIRKVKDEVGYQVSSNDLELISISDDINDYAHFVTVGFLVTHYEGEFHLKESEEFSSYGWFLLDQLPENLCFPSKIILEHYKNKTIYDKE